MSVTILATMRYYLNERTAKYAQVAREVFGITEKDDLLLLSFCLPTELCKCFDPLPFLYFAFSSEVFPVIAFF